MAHKVQKEGVSKNLSEKQQQAIIDFLPVEAEVVVNFQFKLPKKVNVWDIDPRTVIKSYRQILYNWNKCFGTRQFMKHLISSYLPFKDDYKVIAFKQTSQASEPIKCSITGYSLTSVFEIKKFWDSINNPELSSSAREELVKSAPAELQNVQLACKSPKTDKHLQLESIVALQQFVDQMIAIKDKEVLAIMRNIEKDESAKNRVNMYQNEFKMSGLLDNKTIQKIQNLNFNKK